MRMVEIIKSRRAARGPRALDFRMLVDQGKCGVNAAFAGEAAAPGPSALAERFFNQRTLGDPLWLRSLRFAISVLTPPGVCWALHYDQGIVFALVPSIASFSTDPGGPPLSRLIWAAGGGMAFVAGNVAGGVVASGAERSALLAA